MLQHKLRLEFLIPPLEILPLWQFLRQEEKKKKQGHNIGILQLLEETPEVIDLIFMLSDCNPLK